MVVGDEMLVELDKYLDELVELDMRDDALTKIIIQVEDDEVLDDLDRLERVILLKRVVVLDENDVFDIDDDEEVELVIMQLLIIVLILVLWMGDDIELIP